MFQEKPTCTKIIDYCKQSMLNPKHLTACVLKDSVILIRNKPLMVFQFLLPLIQISIILLAIGGNPKDVPIAVVNEDQGYMFGASLSERYISYLQKGDLVKLEFYKTLDEAEDSALNGKVTGVAYFGQNYTRDLVSRALDFQNT